MKVWNKHHKWGKVGESGVTLCLLVSTYIT